MGWGGVTYGIASAALNEAGPTMEHAVCEFWVTGEPAG